MIKKLFLSLTAFLILNVSLFSTEMGKIETECIVDYQELDFSEVKIKQALHDHGIIAVKGVPGLMRFMQTISKLLETLLP